jgi:LPXTG-site transpeptidase (sortase) family protein
MRENESRPETGATLKGRAHLAIFHAGQRPDSSTAPARRTGGSDQNGVMTPLRPRTVSPRRRLGVILFALAAVSGTVACAPPRVHVGPLPTRLISAEMGRDLPVYTGITMRLLNRGGAGWDPESSGLIEAGTVVLFAHRISHGGPFLTLDRLRPGNRVYLRGSNGQLFEYGVVGTDITAPNWASVLAWKPASGWGLILVACHPPGSIRYRIVVHAELLRVI